MYCSIIIDSYICKAYKLDYTTHESGDTPFEDINNLTQPYNANINRKRTGNSYGKGGDEN